MKDRLKSKPDLAGPAGGGTKSATKPNLYLNYTADVKSCHGFNELIKIQPEVLLRAARGQNGGAARLFFLAKHFNQSGSRTIEDKAFRRWLLSLGISRRVYENWLNRALEIGIITRRDQWLDLLGRDSAFPILGANKIYKRGALIEIKKLIGKGWQAYAWAAYVKRFEDQPISQAKLRELTDIPERDQRQYERRAGVIKTRNIALDRSRKADQASGAIEFGRPGVFVCKSADCLAWGLPNSRAVPGIELGNKGRNRKIQKGINRLCLMARDGKALRIYHESEKALKTTFKQLRKASIRGETLPDWLYLRTNQPRFWTAEAV